MSKKKTFFSPAQMMILDGGIVVGDGTNGGVDDAKPNPFIDEDDEIILPDGSVNVGDGEVIIPNDGSSDFSADEAYY